MKQGMKVVGAIAAVVAVVVVIAVVIYGVRWFAAEPMGKLEQRETVQSGEFRKYSYEHFYDLCAAIQRNERALQTQKEVDSDSSRVQQNIVALKSQLQSKISTYNGDARKEKTMGQFKANDLPQRIEYNEEEITECR